MKDTLKRKCDLFIENQKALKEATKWENTYIYPVCANIFVNQDMCITKEGFEESKKVLTSETNILSTFRGNVKLPTISLLARNSSPLIKMQQVNEFYKLLRENFWSSDYLALSAIILSDMTTLSEAPSYIQRGRALYDLIKKEHPFLTSSEDYVFAILLSFSEKSNEQLINDMEYIYKSLKKLGADSNSLQSLSHILSLTNGDNDVKCEKIMALFEGLKAKGRKYGRMYELPVLGALAILPTNTDKLISDILEVDEFLSTQKGYGLIGYDKKTRLMHAAMLVVDEYTASNLDNGTIAAVTSTLSLIAAQQAAMCAVIACSTATSASHSS